MIIDMRSDTVTLPTERMLEQMKRAPLGDDVLREDPTAKALEARAAALFGKEAGLFVPSGTMGNLCALITHARRGERVICGAESHVFRYEAGGASALGGLVYHPLPNQADGALDASAFEQAVREHVVAAEDGHLARAGVVTLEITHNRCGGTVPSVAALETCAAAARAVRLPVHVDGARIFNAHVASGVSLVRYGALADSLQLCLSKGLSAPVGSVLVGSASFVAEARRARKMLGGGMRQVGILAAAGLVALETMVARLADDHAAARALASALRGATAFPLEVREPETNIVFFRARDTSVPRERVVAWLRDLGVLVGCLGEWVRAVTHAGASGAAVAEVAQRLARAPRVPSTLIE